jgi:hypothetical protein
LNGKTVEVGEVLEVPVRWTTPYTEGELAKRAFVHFSDNECPPLLLTIRARVRRSIICSVDLIDIKATSTKDSRSQTFTVAQVPNAPPFELARVSTNVPTLRADFEPFGRARLGKVNTWRVTVTAVPPLGKGKKVGSVFLHASDPSLQAISLQAVVAVGPTGLRDEKLDFR